MHNWYEHHNNPVELVREIRLQKTTIEIPDIVPNDRELRDSYQTARVLDTYLYWYFSNHQKMLKQLNIAQEVETILQNFKYEVLRSMRREKEKFMKDLNQTRKINSFKNIFEFQAVKTYTFLISILDLLQKA